MKYLADIRCMFNAPLSLRQWLADQGHSPQRDKQEHFKQLCKLPAQMADRQQPDESKKSLYRRNFEALPEVDRPVEDEIKGICPASNGDWLCTKALNHEGDHIAHGSFANILHRWPQGGGK